jgi:hypothetical protein
MLFVEKKSQYITRLLPSRMAKGYCLADAGREWVVFLNAAKPFTLTIQGHIGSLKAEWFNP